MVPVVRTRSLFLHPSSHVVLLRLRRRSSSTTTRTTDTALNSDDIQGEDVGQTAKAAAAEQKQKAETEDWSTSCIGFDGRPIDREDWSNEKVEFVDDSKRYYAHHKASPLSEIEFVDTRKPITRATDAVEGDMGRGVMVEETVDQALARAEEIFRMRAMMGDPSLPHSKVLRRMLRQSCDSSVDAQ
ncbi:uncharacterized protein LOC122024681 [Zingiber officinale]|uniref:uncharacterized protein LOC122024681 n=1 Tax=Zingiber officinale TaxID=94328 RepID=UPI001C4BC47A|nr:uncharacterized protein LOC122024681 [Zingiber officinale]